MSDSPPSFPIGLDLDRLLSEVDSIERSIKRLNSCESDLVNLSSVASRIPGSLSTEVVDNVQRTRRALSNLRRELESRAEQKMSRVANAQTVASLGVELFRSLGVTVSYNATTAEYTITRPHPGQPQPHRVVFRGKGVGVDFQLYAQVANHFLELQRTFKV